MTMAAVFAASSIVFGGCGQDEQQQQAQVQKAQVKAMKVIRRDTPLASEYAGHLVGTEEIQVQSKVSGNIVEKYIVGGQFVEQGQLLYKIDARQFNSAVLRAQADLAQAEAVLEQSIATYNNSLKDLRRNEELYKDAAIAEQVVTTQAAKVRADEATCAANEAAIYACQAALKIAQQDLADTEIYAPMSGQLGVDDVSIGTFVSAGQTTLVTLGAPDPIFVQFSISESDYLHFMTVQNMQSEHNPIDVTITLADGKEYPFEGQIVEVDRELANSTGSLIMKAIFPNPSGLLMPGMFARVKLTGEVIPNAILVPQRSVQQLLGKSFVMVVGNGDKSEARTVELGEQVGSYFVVNKGINTNDTVIVEGLTNLREGVELNVKTVTPGEMGFTLANVTSTYNADAGVTSANTNPNAPDSLRGK
ncbi:MAG: efflux RND transporter periplasmic adaptor subunit [Selenomonadaceae bacterium]|nr:efflux RND transporter periplasmic adaptor subunit [Selenomonadaceae bacterium]